MNMLYRLPIRYQLRLIVIIMALPVVGILINTGINDRKEAMNVAQKDTQQLAEKIAYEQQNMVASVRQMLVSLSQLPEIKRKDVSKITTLLSEVHKVNPEFTNIFVADRSGTVWASAVPTKPPFVISDRRYFKNALASGKLSSGEYVVSRALNKATLNFGYPIEDDKGNVTGVIAAGFLLEKYAKYLERSKLPQNASFVLLDHKGVFLFRAIEPENFIGKQSNPDMFKKIQEGSDESTIVGTALSTGDIRIITTRKLRLEGEPIPYIYIRAGIPVESALAAVNTQLLGNFIYLSCALVLVLLFSSFIGRRSIVSRIELLEKASHKLAKGDYKAKISNQVIGGELGQLAESFDLMATELVQREEALSYTQKRMHSFIANAPVILFVMDKDGILTFSDGRGLEALGLRPGQVVGQSALDLYKDSPSTVDGIRRALAGEYFSVENVVGDKVFETWYNPVRNNLGELSGSIGVATDITERKQAEKSAQEKEYNYRILFESANDGIFLQDATGFLDCNQRGADMYGLPREQIIGHHPANFSPEYQPDGRLSSEVAAEKITATLNGDPQTFEWQPMRANGTPFDVEITLNKVELGDKACLIAIVRDITERKLHQKILAEDRRKLETQLAEITALQHRLQEQAVRDPLTGLNNRRYLNETLPRELSRAKREGYPLALIMLDLDHFKKINDTYGHQAGDVVLVYLSSILINNARESDIFCRYGGEEFIVVLPRMSLDNAFQRVEEWRLMFSEKPVKHGELLINVTFSGGISVFPEHAADADTLIALADDALYTSKKKGRDCISCTARPER